MLSPFVLKLNYDFTETKISVKHQKRIQEGLEVIRTYLQNAT